MLFLFNFHLMTTKEASCGAGWMNVSYNGCVLPLDCWDYFYFTQCVLDQQHMLTRENRRSISTSFRNLVWCLHHTESGKNELINSNKNEGYDFKLWCLPSVFHNSLTPRHVSHTGEPSEHWEAPSAVQEAHRPLCWDTCLLPFARTKSLITWKSITMLLTPCCFSSWFRAVIYWQLGVVSNHVTSLWRLVQRNHSFRVSKLELETYFTWPFLFCMHSKHSYYMTIFSLQRMQRIPHKTRFS